MHIIVPMAGHSRRFHEAGFEEPKWLLQVGAKTMIEHVVDMFSATDKFHFVVNNEQVAAGSGIVQRLQQIASYVQVHIIDPHEFGPVESVMQVVGIADDEEVIVSYCDFFVQWNYDRFLRHIHGVDGAIVSFRGFHPASFGETTYAYMRCDGEVLVELREKESFTDDRVSEPASTGVYYFSRFEDFKRYGKLVLADQARGLPEAYVSLLYNHMASDGLRTVLYDVDRFVCLGTPEDYHQHQFFWRYFSRNPSQEDVRHKPGNRINMIPMAGHGARFRDYGYRTAKPLIDVRGKSMVLRAVESMPSADKWIFLPRAEDLQNHPIEAALRNFSKDCQILPVSSLTSGPAATCLLAADDIEDQAELLIASCDYEVGYDRVAWQRVIDDPEIDGAIWTFRLGGNVVKSPTAFAYCRTASDGREITEIVEKATISENFRTDPLLIGTIWYRQGADFVRGVQSMMESETTVSGEYYVGTSVNQLLAEGKRFVIFDVNQWISFGDPFEIQILEFWEEVFLAQGVIS